MSAFCQRDEVHVSASPEQRTLWRNQLLSELYDATDADPGRRVGLGEVGVRFGLGGADLESTARFLKGERLINFDSPTPDVIGPVSITTAGIRRAESLREARQVSDADHSSGPDPRTDLAGILQPAEQGQGEAVVGQLRRALDTGELGHTNQDDQADFQAQLDALNAELRSPKPKRAIVGRLLWALRWIPTVTFGGVAGN